MMISASIEFSRIQNQAFGVAMFEIKALPDGHPAFAKARLLSVFYHAVNYIEKHGAIGLTKSKAFNRKFCHWMAETYDWPEHSASYLLEIQKVLDELDVLPVYVFHDICVDWRLGRHTKDGFKFTKAALVQMKDKGRFFADLAAYYLFQYESELIRSAFRALGNWDVYLNVINIEAEDGGVTSKGLLKTLYGFDGYTPGLKDEAYNHHTYIVVKILEPLYWLGFLDRIDRRSFGGGDSVYTKTALWREALKLDPLPPPKHLGNSLTLH